VLLIVVYSYKHEHRASSCANESNPEEYNIYNVRRVYVILEWWPIKEFHEGFLGSFIHARDKRATTTDDMAAAENTPSVIPNATHFLVTLYHLG